MTTAGGAPPQPPAPAVDGAALPAGYRVNEYVIERTLGGGGFGITYLARDNNLDLPVAIKEYFPSELATRGADNTVHLRAGSEDSRNQYEWGLERFLDEARALATFRHPNIVRVLRYFRDNGTAYIVMEYESGLALKRWVPQNAPLTLKSVLSLVHPLLDGLEQVHKAGFLHRDIKPDNIYVRADNAPVLLDFGSARRVSANKDLTNIVSPGFAPFEQYHSHGHQGPWTDIYSLGAVLYWMVTGKKPMESAARVKTDSMLPASTLADATQYGQALLAAIDWALQPEESKRPQSVEQFRAAIGGPEPADNTRPVSAGDRSALAASGFAKSGLAPSGSVPSQKRTLLCTIMFLDLVGYSKRSVDDQVAIKKLFNELLAKALRGVPDDTRISIDTGDGAAICFMGDPEEALHCALLLRDLLGQRYGKLLSLRIGLHMGPVRVVSDINERVNVIGDGINVAQRVMDFAQPNQVLVSRGYYDVISRITDDTADMFMYLGQFADKHGRMHEIYSVGQGGKTATTKREGPSTGYTQTVRPPDSSLDDESVHEVEVELARHIGPLSRVLVKKARPLAGSIEELREALAPTIQEPRARELFLSGHTGHSHPPNSQSQPVKSRATTQPRGATQPRPNTQPRPPTSGPPSSVPARATGASVPWGGNSIPMSRTTAASQPMSRSALASQPVTSRPNTVPVDLPPEEVTTIEHTLSRFIGPMARIVVRKELARSGTFKELAVALAANVDKQDQRDAFLAALHKALPRRNF
jgi:serine/threonine protein kinase